MNAGRRMSLQRVLVEADLAGFDYSGLSPDAQARVRRFFQNCIGKTPDEALALIDEAVSAVSAINRGRGLVVKRSGRQ